MSAAPRLLPDERLVALAAEHGTPLYVYDLQRVLAQVQRLSAFDVVRYAQKANGFPPLLARLAQAGLAVDAVSAGEIEGALAAGFAPQSIVYTSDLFTPEALALVGKHRLHVNCGSACMIEELARVTPGARVTLRVNPGFGAGHGPKVTTGGAASKHGVWHAELGEAFERCARAGLTPTGLHVHIGSGVELASLEQVVGAMGRFLAAAPPTVATVSAGGGLPVPYGPGDEPFDVERFAGVWSRAKGAWEGELDRPLTLEVEPGRYLVAEAGALLTTVRAVKRTEGYEWALVDAGFHTLLRPAMYGAHHRVSAVGREGEPLVPQVIAGPLCESADVLTQDGSGRPEPRPLPRLAPGDLLCVHDAGAYGACMASTYNAMPLPGEVAVEGSATGRGA